MATVKAAAIYARISADVAGDGLGVQRQLEDCRRLAMDSGWQVAEEYVDNDVSAFRGKSRPEYQRMLADIAAGAVDAVIVYNLDRLTRRPAELEEFAEVCTRAGLDTVRSITSDFNIGNDDGLFMARLIAAFAAKESGRKSARMKRKAQQRAEAGLPHVTGIRPFGYDSSGMVIVESEAAIIRELAARFVAGESMRSLAAWLDDQGIPTTNGGARWQTPTVRQILVSGRIAGIREYHGVAVGPAAWPAIITTEMHQRIIAAHQARRRSKRRTPRRYLLSGMLRCGKCGNTLFSSKRETTRRYVCLSGPDHGGCGRLTIVAEPVEMLIAEAALEVLDTPELAAALKGEADSNEQAAALHRQLADDQDLLDEFSEMAAARQITTQEWLKARKPVEERIVSAQNQLARLSGNTTLSRLVGDGKRLRTSWSQLNLDRQTAIVRAVIDHVVIAPGRASAAMDPARVKPVWLF